MTKPSSLYKNSQAKSIRQTQLGHFAKQCDTKMSRDKTCPDKSEPTWMFCHKCVKLVSHNCPTVASKLLRKQVRTKMSRPEMSSPMTSAVRDSWEECPDLLSSSQFLLLTFICVLNSKKGDRANEKNWIKAPLCR